MIGGDKYKNRDGRLPDAPGSVWYEADFDYTGGYRDDCRLLYSNDGLIFVTCWLYQRPSTEVKEKLRQDQIKYQVLD